VSYDKHYVQVIGKMFVTVLTGKAITCVSFLNFCCKCQSKFSYSEILF